MKIEGNWTFSAARELVWSLLHDPVTIRHALPSCEEFDQIGPSEYIATLRIQQGPFKGRYQGQIQLLDDEQLDRFALTIVGEGPDGTISGNGMLYLEQQDDSILVHYAGDVDYFGRIAEESPRMIQTMANSLIRQFFEAIDYQVRMQTGIHTTRLPDDILRSRRPGSEDLQDAVAELKQDRRTLWIVLALTFFAFFTFTGATMLLLVLIRWGKRTFDGRVATILHKHQQSGDSLEHP